MLSDYAKQLKIAKGTNVVTPGQMVEKLRSAAATETLVALILDDFAGTGNQLRAAADSFVERMACSGAASWTEQLIIVVGAALGAEDFVWNPEPDVRGYSVTGVVVPARLKAFDPDAEIFDGADVRTRAQDLMTTIGRSLVRGNPLGFGDQGLLLSLQNNCPNNTLPIFWANGEYAGNPWLPLFDCRS
jgi:hypothetical protein